MTDDPVAGLRACVDEDERIARAVQQPDDRRWEAWHPAGEEAEGTVRWEVGGVAQPTHVDPLNKARMLHIARQDPARALAEVAAKRRIMARHSIDPARATDRLWARACQGCGTTGDCDDPVTEDINDCPELRDLAAVYDQYPSSRPE